MVDNSLYLRSQKQVLISKNNNFIIDEDYDVDVDVTIILDDRLRSLNNSHIFKKYIGLNRYYVFFILRICNPLVKIQIMEGSPSNIHNVFYSKDEKYNNCIYVFFHSLTNKVTNIRHIIKN